MALTILTVCCFPYGYAAIMTLQSIKSIEQVVTTSPFHLLQKSKIWYIEYQLVFLLKKS